MLDIGGRVFEVLVVTLGGGALATLCGGSLLRILVNVVIASAWRIFLLTADGIVFCSALRRWPAASIELSTSEMVGTVQWAG